MIATIAGALTSRLAGPVAAAAAIALALVSVGQCSAKNTEARRADRAEATLATELVNLDRCRTNVAGLEASVGAQNARIEAVRAEGQRKTEEAENALAAAQKGRAAVEARVASLLRDRPAGADACARMESADAAVLGSLR